MDGSSYSAKPPGRVIVVTCSNESKSNIMAEERANRGRTYLRAEAGLIHDPVIDRGMRHTNPKRKPKQLLICGYDD